jgi:antirestriction protein ArdC
MVIGVFTFSRRNCDLSGGFGSSAYAREELIAEMTGSLVWAALSIVLTLRHASYLGSSLEALPKALYYNSCFFLRIPLTAVMIADGC